MLNILIMGAGAIGCFVGGSLAAAGHRVTLVGRAALMDTVSSAGLKIEWPAGQTLSARPRTSTGVVATDGPYDFILLTVKTPATATAAKQLATLALTDGPTYLVSLQNGVGSEELLADRFRPEQIIAGTITIPISVPEPGRIVVSKAKGGLGLAPLAPDQPVERLAKALTEAGLVTPIYTSYQAMKWSKLLLNIVNNASSAILNQTPAQIIDQPALFNLEIQALQEGVAVMKAQGIEAVKLPGYPVDWLARLVSARWLPLAAKRAILRPFMRSGRGSKMPSLQIDLAAGRATSEIGALNGAIVQAGRRLGIATPVNQALTDIVSGLVSGQLAWSEYQNNSAKLLKAATSK